MTRYRWLLWDADGTLFDYDAAEEIALATTFDAYGVGYEIAYSDAYRRINSAIWRAFERGEIAAEALRTERFRRLFQALGVDLDPNSFSARYLAHLGERADLIDGAADVVRRLYGQVGMALITNGLKDVQRSRLRRSSLAPYLSAVLISEEVGSAKPDRGIFDAAFEAMGHPDKYEVLIVGDSLTSDMRGGLAYGIDTCWYNPSGAPRDPPVDVCYEIDDLGVLPAIVLGD
ncbi:MAG: YjjG family noncanonical pyrimidine nucleotidase [Anaerolineae bacterium]|nr:YjjG family noncanonical pyrimidine nucleotidase [Anaerolineae bacterium]